MAVSPATRFSFDFGDLFQPPAEPLRVLEPAGEPVPARALPVAADRRPRWLGRLLPVLRRGDSMRVEIVVAPAPGFADHLASTLAAIYAAAGAGGGGSVLLWPGGLALGWDGLATVPPAPSQVVVACDLSAASVALAAEAGAERPGAWLVVNGALPAVLDRLGLEGDRLIALPLLGPREVAAESGAGALAGLSRSHRRASLGLAAALLRAHLLREG